MAKYQSASGSAAEDLFIDLTKVRFNSVQYNIRDLESKIFVPERNRLIAETWLTA